MIRPHQFFVNPQISEDNVFQREAVGYATATQHSQYRVIRRIGALHARGHPFITALKWSLPALERARVLARAWNRSLESQPGIAAWNRSLESQPGIAA
jgi:hypothetical protein